MLRGWSRRAGRCAAGFSVVCGRSAMVDQGRQPYLRNSIWIGPSRSPRAN
jgi:hypothetical protein